MAGGSGQRILAVVGSGETGPTMTTVHRELCDRAGVRSGVLLDSPYRFQENATEVSAKAVAYFARSVGLPVEVLGAQWATSDPALAEQAAARVRASDWVFAGPGSPSYALTQWGSSAAGQALRYRLVRGHGVTVFASAAACVLGRAALPVYEIYKAGAPPHWIAGLDLLAPLGLPVVVIPHYDNTEGRTHDTRYCYLGERRLRLLEDQLPQGTAVLGVDEHTALIIDLAARTIQVRGRGRVTVRHHGDSQILPSGTDTTLADLQAIAAGSRPARPPAAPTLDPAGPAATGPTFAESIEDCQHRFDDAERLGDVAAMSRSVLDLDAALVGWATDTDVDDATHAHSVLRSMITRLGQAARRPPAPTVTALLALREQFRHERAYRQADAVRHALEIVGVHIDDTPDGPRWHADRPGLHPPP